VDAGYREIGLICCLCGALLVELDAQFCEDGAETIGFEADLEQM